MKNDFHKFHKIMGIVVELYEMDPEYFRDCFFNMYYQMKTKKVIDEASHGDEELKKKIWSAVNFFRKLRSEDKMEAGKAFNIAYKSNNIDKALFSSVANACRAFKGAKNTKFKDL